VLKKLYPKVVYVRNITDVDDKIINKALKTGHSIDEITKQTEEMFHNDIEELNVLEPDYEPRATEHIDEMIELCQNLIKRGFAYVSQNHVLFDINKFEGYGRLANKNLEELIAGSRVEVESYKRNAGDFVLWKPSDENQPGWDSPWSFGRPGWHIECSAMSFKYLGGDFDIHGGGVDLVFPHHENEIAQSVCGYDCSFAKYWVHNGHLMVDGKKMSKSLGNFFTIRDILNKYNGETIRFYLMQTHYHQPLDWKETGIRSAKLLLDKFYQALRSNQDIPLNENTKYSMEVFNALLDDLNTPKAINALYNICANLNKAVDYNERANLKTMLIKTGEILGILQKDPDEWFKAEAFDFSENQIQEMINKRADFKKNKKFTEADSIRNDLAARGIILEDTSKGTVWRKI
jgi:cysteinyl-tRNA synthetase